MKKKLLFAFAATISLTSCSGYYENKSGTETDNQITQQLINTCWMTKSTTIYDYNNKETLFFDNTKYPDYLTFTNIKSTYCDNDCFILYVDYNKYHPYYTGYTKCGYWYVSNNILKGDPGAGHSFGEILNLSPNELRTKYILSDMEYGIEVYIPAKEPTHKFEEKDDNNNGGGTTTYEKPDIGFYDFTATRTSLKVQYKIYNKDNAKVTSAKIYYGTSSNPSSSANATVSGVLITANITGLKAGTTYYVKCSATGKGGTTTTTTTKCITNY